MYSMHWYVKHRLSKRVVVGHAVGSVGFSQDCNIRLPIAERSETSCWPALLLLWVLQKGELKFFSR